jgi:hypothetical protein
MLFYRAALPLSSRPLTSAAGIIRRHRAGTGPGRRKLNPIVDGTLIPIDRVAADRPFYSGKHKKHGMNLQVIASLSGDILWVSGAPPGSVHDKKAERVWGVLDELEAAGLISPADKRYQGSTYAKIPYKGKNKPQSRKDANRRTRNSAHPEKGQTPSSRPNAA